MRGDLWPNLVPTAHWLAFVVGAVTLSYFALRRRTAMRFLNRASLPEEISPSTSSSLGLWAMMAVAGWLVIQVTFSAVQFTPPKTVFLEVKSSTLPGGFETRSLQMPGVLETWFRYIFASLAVILFFLQIPWRRGGARGLRQVGLAMSGWRRFFLIGFAASLVIVPLTTFLGDLIALFLVILGGEQIAPQGLVDRIAWMIEHQDWMRLVPCLLSPLILAPILEEILFRGYLQSAFREWFLGMTGVGLRWAPWLSITLTSGLFVLVHVEGSGVHLFPLFVLSLTLGFLRDRLQSLAPAIALHFFFNFFNLIMFWQEMLYGGH